MTALETEPKHHPAGGNDPTRFDVREVWYPVYYLKDLNPEKLAKFTLLDQDLVLWWDEAAQSWQAFLDQCPHRLAPLSEGRINEGGWLECPYHGWAFSGTGRCEFIPQQRAGGSAQTAQRACATSFPTATAQGLLFVYPGNRDNATQTPLPLVEPLLDDSDEWVCLDIFRDLPYDALTLLENVLDSSHIPYTHHKTVGNRVNVSPVDLEILASGKQGFQGMWAEGPRKGTLGRQDTLFVAPGLMWHDLTSEQFGRTLTVVYATPIRSGECRLFARFPFKFSAKLPRLILKLTPRWYSHINQNGVLEDDQIFLHYQERYLEAAGGSEAFARAFYLPTRADLFVSEFRQWVNQYQAKPFPDTPLPPPLPKEKLLDRYHSHTIHCASCSGALANLQRLRLGIFVLGAIAWAIIPLATLTLGNRSAIFFPLFALLLLATGWGLSQLERKFYEGRAVPPRNLPEK
ncbi:Rieske 2Fe-2S domain-containing protein [Lusitaniella coriacea]|uniref:aromatic ring-hydroxylating dioxygenase subunit alpha n=1 Tax=Lusitaniella coriacea TaxID=1983105 RepID=UPI003CEF847C